MTTSDSNNEPAAARLSETFAAIIHRVAAWWSSPPIPPRVPRVLVWGGRDLSALGHRVHVHGNELRLELVSRKTGTGVALRRGPFEELWKQPLEGEAADGWRFRAQTAYVTSWGASGKDSDREETAQVCGRDWTFVAEGGRTQYWVAEVHGDPPVYIGNLTLTSGKYAFSRGHYLLTGPECDYALVTQGREKDRWLLVVHERLPDTLTHRVLRRDLNALSFSFGTPLGVGNLWSVDEDLRHRAILGGDIATRGRKGMTEQAPVPSTNDLDALPAVMFEKFARYLSTRTDEENARPILACWHYLESLAEVSAEGALIKIALAAAVMARHVLENDLGLVRDPPAFAAWLSAHDTELADLARPERREMLRAQLARAADASASNAIRLGLANVGLGVPPEITEALAAAESSLSGAEGTRQGFYENFARLRGVVAAFVARTVGYQGRLAGWDRAGDYSFYLPAPSEWWPADEGVSATFYSAARTEETQDLAALWPSIEIPTVPSSGLIGLLAQHAAGLASRTDGRVYADLQPLPLDSSGAARRYEFALRASNRTATKITLFIVRPVGNDVVIDGWDENVTLQTAADVHRFLNRMKDAPETTASIERLLLAALEAARDGTG